MLIFHFHAIYFCIKLDFLKDFYSYRNRVKLILIYEFLNFTGLVIFEKKNAKKQINKFSYSFRTKKYPQLIQLTFKNVLQSATIAITI